MSRKILTRKEEIEEYKAMINCYFDIPTEEDIFTLNEIQKKKIKKMLEMHGELIGIKFDYGTVEKTSDLEKLLWSDVIIPAKNINNKELEELKIMVKQFKKHPSFKTIDKIYEIAEKKDGETLIWF